MELQNLIGYVAAILGSFAFLPQVVKTWKTKETKDISLVMYIIFWLGVISWLAYGILIKKPPIIMVNIIIAILASAMLIFKIKFGNIDKR